MLNAMLMCLIRVCELIARLCTSMCTLFFFLLKQNEEDRSLSGDQTNSSLGEGAITRISESHDIVVVAQVQVRFYSPIVFSKLLTFCK